MWQVIRAAASRGLREGWRGHIMPTLLLSAPQIFRPFNGPEITILSRRFNELFTVMSGKFRFGTKF